MGCMYATAPSLLRPRATLEALGLRANATMKNLGVDTPGGSVDGSDDLLNQLKGYRK